MTWARMNTCLNKLSGAVMKGFIIRIVLVALQTSLFAVAAGAETSPHFSNGYTCFTCHYTNLFLDIKGVNCLNCHNPGDPYGHGKAFTTADIANPFNTWTGAPAPVRYQSSHNWTGNFTVPGAGALPPENPALTWDCNASTAANEVYCSRCHSTHPRSAIQSCWRRSACNSAGLRHRCHTRCCF